MSTGDIKPIPDSFLAKLLQEFGLQWTHIVVLSGVVFSSFELQNYLNPGVWTLATITGLSIVYVFRQYISPNFPKVSLRAGIGLVLALSIPVTLLLALGLDPRNFLKYWSKISTVYLALAFAITFGTVIISYRGRDEYRYTPLPLALAEASKAIARSIFIHEAVDYTIQLTRQESDEVLVRVEVRMRIVNRTDSPAKYDDVFDPAGQKKQFLRAEINGASIDCSDPARQFRNGLRLEHIAGPKECFQVVVTNESTFHSRDSEVIGVYFPCAEFAIRVRYPADKLWVHMEPLLREHAEAKRLDSGELFLQYLGGLLPFQGVRLAWSPPEQGYGWQV